jgi:ubiquinone/menaquinone biosynthesis C-methylase UbiE
MPLEDVFKNIRLEYGYFKKKSWSLAQMGSFWDSIIDYDDINDSTPSYFRRFVDGYRLSNLPDNCYTLDISSRTGNGTAFFWEKGKISKAVCVDFSRHFLDVCAQRLKTKGIPFQAKLVESLPLPFKDAEFDAILCFETVEHVSEPDIFIKELSRVLKVGGSMILTTPNIIWEPIFYLAPIFNMHHSEGPHRCLTRKKIVSYIRESGLTIQQEETTVLVPAGPHVLVKVGEWLEKKTKHTLMPYLGLRRIFICRKE